MQSTLNSVTQSTQRTRSLRLLIGPPHAAPPGTCTAGQWPTKPMPLGPNGPGDEHVTPSVDSVSQALQIFPTFFDSAFWIAMPALPSPGTGHGNVAVPL